MENIHKILRYDFASIDLNNFIDDFKSVRRQKCLSLFNYDIDAKSSDDIQSILHKYFESIGSVTCAVQNGFETRFFFKYYLKQYHDKSILGSDYDLIVDKLQKRFEIYHRIYNSYDRTIRKSSEAFCDIEIYVLFSLVLLSRYAYKKNYNDLNTSLKINDLILFSDWEISKASENFILLPFLFEKRLLSEC